MIEFSRSYQTSDGQTFANLEFAKMHQLKLLIPALDADECKYIVEAAEQVVDILTIKPNSKPKARKLHGGTKRRKLPAVTEPQME